MDIMASQQSILVAPCLTFEGSSTFEIQRKEELELVLNNITLLFHSNYFKLNRLPVLVFDTTELEQIFFTQYQPLGLGDLVSINREKQSHYDADSRITPDLDKPEYVMF